MRLAPVALFFYPDEELIRHFSAESARTTHGAFECLEACRLLGDILFRALSRMEKFEVQISTHPELIEAEKIKEIASGDYLNKPESGIQGSGYVVKSLQAALAAVCGQVAGAFYGEGGIPEHWLKRLVLRDEIRQMADRLYGASPFI